MRGRERETSLRIKKYIAIERGEHGGKQWKWNLTNEPNKIRIRSVIDPQAIHRYLIK